jgi:hypothetical protein
MTVNLNRKIGVSSASLGGYSARRLPAPGGYGVKYQSLIFMPSLAGDTWQVTGDRVIDLEQQVFPDSAPTPLFRAGQGPYPKADAVRFTPFDWRSLSAESTFVLPPTSGLTLEFYVNFGPNGTPEPGYIYGSTFACFLTSAPLDPLSGYVSPPYIGLYTEAYAESTTDSGFISLTYTRPSAFGYTKKVIDGTMADVDNIGWKHFALEVAASGDFTLFFDGAPVTPGASWPATTPISFFGDLDTFVPAWVFFVQNNAPAPRPYLDVHGVRYTKGLLYNGQEFTPPRLQL